MLTFGTTVKIFAAFYFGCSGYVTDVYRYDNGSYEYKVKITRCKKVIAPDVPGAWILAKDLKEESK